jgi:hypothetical protein
MTSFHLRVQYLSGLLTLALALVLLIACTTPGGGNPPSKPTVLILVPTSGESFTEGQSVSVQSVAADPFGVTRVELLIDGQFVEESRPPNPQGEVQFSVIQNWQAAGVGPHILLVRAFNAAGVSGETSIPIAVNSTTAPQPSPVASQTSALPTVTPIVNPTTVPTIANATATTVPVSPTAVPPTVPPTAIPPTIPPTPPPPTPIPPTVPPLVFLPPFDGGMSVFVDWNGEEMQIEAQANDTLVGNDSGDGIAYIEFFIQDLQGSVIATKRENTEPYCFFGEAQGQCLLAGPGDPNFRWSANREITEGWYFIRAVAHTPDNRIQVAEQPLLVEFSGDGIQDLFAFVVDPFNFNIERELTVEAQVEGDAVSSGIQRVDFIIVDYDGKVVHTRTEQSARWCGFSGGEGNFPCNRYVFAQNGGRWSNGTPVYPTQYIIRAIAYANNGAVAAGTFFFQIDRVQ